jgi:hypothetical protein
VIFPGKPGPSDKSGFLEKGTRLFVDGISRPKEARPKMTGLPISVSIGGI